MDNEAVRNEQPRRWPDLQETAVVGGVWALLAVFTSFEPMLVIQGTHALPVPWASRLIGNLLDCTVWAVLTLPVVWTARSLPPLGPRAVRSLAVHAGVAVVLIPAFLFLRSLIRIDIDGRHWFITLQVLREDPVGTFATRYAQSALRVGVIVAAVTLFDQRGRQLRQARVDAALTLRTAELEAQLERARSAALRLQISPHFLFNTLNAIGAETARDSGRAERMVARLADLMRATVSLADVQEVTLASELDWLDDYLDIQKERFGERLSVSVHADPQALELAVPPLLLQPLVENAFRHGLERDHTAGLLRIECRAISGELVIRILNEGPAPAASGAGVGLTNTRARLRTLHGDRATLTLRRLEDSLTEVRISLPSRTLADTGSV